MPRYITRPSKDGRRKTITGARWNVGPRSVIPDTERVSLIDDRQVARAMLSRVQVDLKPEKAWRVALGKHRRLRCETSDRVTSSYTRYPGGAHAWPGNLGRLLFLLLLVAVVEVATGGTRGRPDRGACQVLA